MHLYNLSDEEKLLLLLSRPMPEKIKKKDMIAVLSKNPCINHKKILRLALANGVAGFLYKNTLEEKIFPEAIQADLHKVYKQTAFYNIHLLRTTLEILKLLSRNHIKTVPLKGAAASDLIFNDFGVYPSGDIDVLVHPSNLQQSKRLLCHEGGFNQTHEIAEKDLLSDHYHLLLHRNNILLEIHWNLVKRYFSILPDFWFEGSKKIMWNGIPCFELPIEKYILYHIFRLFDHCFYPLRFYVLLAGVIEQNQERIDWEKVMIFSDQYQMKKLVLFSLGLLNDLLDTNIPHHLLPKKNKKYQYLRRLAYRGIFFGIHNKHRRMMLYTSLLIEPGTLTAILIKRVFPSKGELRMRYNIPPKSKMVYFFYIFNPFLMLFKKSKTR